MKSLVTTADQKTERAFLVGVEFKSKPKWELQDSLEELGRLASTAGAEVIGIGTQKLDRPYASTFIGTGKADEFAALCQADEADTVIFDDELSPAQSRNLEKIFECKVLDRTALILDIFAQRARTREGKLQIELAQLQHLLPRLTRFWTHLSRQKGGIGMRGDGETQLETDRRRVLERIHRITADLKMVQRQRATQRDGRRRTKWPTASLVGYTNAGKSTLFNSLTGADVLQEDKLFATLDPTTRRLQLPTNQNVLLSDTVGFIRKLPHSLVDSFKATLEEVVQSDLLVHVVDVSHPLADEQISVVDQVLGELGAGGKPTLMVFNKSDRLENGEFIPQFSEKYPNAVQVSALKQTGFEALMDELGALLRPIRDFVELAVPHSAADVIARIHEIAEVVEIDYDGPETLLSARIPPHLTREFESYIRSDIETQ
ncbi:MAG: GTP-binding protein HflX [Limisphaerales bacterium]